MIPEKLLEVLSHEAPAAIATQGEDGPHLVNTWNSYIRITGDEKILIPAGGMNTTEANIEKNNGVLITIGSREVEGFHGPGAGFLITGNAVFLKSGTLYESLKQRFPWARAALEVTVISVKQTI